MEGFGFMSKSLKRLIFPADLIQNPSPKRKRLQPPLHFGQERDQQHGYKELNLFIGKHSNSTAIRERRNPTRRETGGGYECQDQQESVLFIQLNEFLLCSWTTVGTLLFMSRFSLSLMAPLAKSKQLLNKAMRSHVSNSLSFRKTSGQNGKPSLRGVKIYFNNNLIHILICGCWYNS